MTLRVLVVSDVRIVQQGLQSLLAQHPDVDVVSTADALHACEQSSRHDPDVILFDAARHHSVEFVKVLVACAPRSRVVAFGVKETEDEILALAAAGTAGYVRDSADTHDVVGTLERVLRDELPCSARTAASLYRRVAALSPDHDLPMPLSRRELQIAHLVGCGLTNKEIGRQLGIESATVKNHVHNMCEKLNVHRRGEVGARIRAILRGNALLPDSLSRPSLTNGNPALEADWTAGGRVSDAPR